MILRVCNSAWCKGQVQEHRPSWDGLGFPFPHSLVRCCECGNVRKLRPVWDALKYETAARPLEGSRDAKV